MQLIILYDKTVDIDDSVVAFSLSEIKQIELNSCL